MQNDAEWLQATAKQIINTPPAALRNPPTPQEYAKNRDIEAYKSKMGSAGQENLWSKAYRKARKKILKNKFKQKP
jgi:hypothetical protein